MYNNRPLTGSTFFFRILGGLVGGITGTIIMLIIYFLSLAALPAEENGSAGITRFVLITMILLSTITTNMVSSQIIAFSDREKYQDSRATLINIFALNLILFIFTTPLYLFTETNNIQIVAAFHLLISAQMSALIMEVFAGDQYPLVGTYGVAFGGITAFSVVAFVINASTGTASGISTIILFIAMPLVWVLLEFFQCLVEVIYTKVYELYAPKEEK